MNKLVWLGVLALIGCKGYVGAATDAAPPDAPPPPPPDAAGPDAPPQPDAGNGLPNLVLLGEYTVDSMMIEDQLFGAGSCSLEEMCIGAAGMRRLLRFSTVTANLGDADIVVGAPSGDNPLFEYGECHGHYHFVKYANYELLDDTGLVARGHKQAFCLEDTDQIDPTKPGQGYNCSYQGISAGWADQYSVALACQWIDITDVPAGSYTLRLSVNYEQVLLESSYDDNVFETPVSIP